METTLQTDSVGVELTAAASFRARVSQLLIGMICHFAYFVIKVVLPVGKRIQFDYSQRISFVFQPLREAGAVHFQESQDCLFYPN